MHRYMTCRFYKFCRAAETNQEEIIHFIFDIRANYDLFTTCDQNQRNVFHCAVENRNVLEYLLLQFVTVGSSFCCLFSRVKKRAQFFTTDLKTITEYEFS